jgi:hypothetical protein
VKIVPVIIGIVVSSGLILGLSKCTGITENNFWDYLDEAQREYFPEVGVNKFVIKDSKKLQRRIIRDVDRAIIDYEKYESSLPQKINMKDKVILKEIETDKYTESQKRLLQDAIYYECPGGVIGIRSGWVEKDVNCSD